MRQKGILATRRQGTTIYYRLATPRIIEACCIMREVLGQALAARGRLSESLAASGGPEGTGSPQADGEESDSP
jgi:ArsR family transcriptional regulator